MREIPLPNVYELEFSPLGSYIVTWERPFKLENGQAGDNLKMFHVSTGAAAGSYVQRNQSGWNLQFTADEKLCARLVTNEIQFMDPADMRKGPVHRLKIEGASQFSLSPGRNNTIAVFVPEKRSAPAVVRIFNVPGFGAPLSQKTFYRAERVQLKWNALGTALLVLTQTDEDSSNKSYYGETNLYLLNVAGNFDSRITLDREGPIHDVSWSPESREFGVVYGYMPAKTTIFDQRGNVLHSLAPAARNFISMSPHSRFVLSAGFGNLSGTIDILQREGMKQIASIEAANTTVCEWSPDAQFFMTATTSPRLRVDNGIKIWHVSGKLIYSQDMNELYQVSWRPQDSSLFPVPERVTALVAPPPHASAASFVPKTPRQAMGAYRPPGLRGTASKPVPTLEELTLNESAYVAPSLRAAGSAANGSGPRGRTVPGATAAANETASASKTALKNKKKREARRDENTASPAVAGATAPAVAGTLLPAGSASAPQPSAISDVDKKIRNLQKKLRAIEELKVRRANGDALEATQLTKIDTEAAVQNELRALGWTG